MELDRHRTAAAVIGLDRWFETMRVEWPTPGFGGPVVHWWRHALSYTGAGLDWRYEGIVAGYLTLFEKAAEVQWLDKAIRAGLDLVEGQRPDGHFTNSSFELNPADAGTPHEAAADVALLMLSQQLLTSDPVLSRGFLDSARHNLEDYWFSKLWHQDSSTLSDRGGAGSFVPNKAATFMEAVLLLAQISGEDGLVEQFAIPTGQHILAMQVRRPGHRLDGAIAQNRFGDRVVEAYFPIYIARCIPPLIKLYDVVGDIQFVNAALAAARFLERIREPDGGYPQVLYGNGSRNRHPRWIAGAGDIVRAMATANAYEAHFDVTPTVRWILSGTRSDGRIATADGFGKIVPILSRRDREYDEVGVVGWCDKAFRALAALACRSSLNETIATRNHSEIEGVVR